MALGPRDVSKIVTGPLSNYTMSFLRHLKDAFNVMFKLGNVENDEDLNIGSDKVNLACVGVGFTNLSKRTTWNIYRNVSLTKSDFFSIKARLGPSNTFVTLQFKGCDSQIAPPT